MLYSISYFSAKKYLEISGNIKILHNMMKPLQ